MNNEQLVLCDHDQKNMKIFEDAGMNVTINCLECRLIYKITDPAIRFGFEKGVTKEDRKKILDYIRINYTPPNPVDITIKIFNAILNKQ